VPGEHWSSGAVNVSVMGTSVEQLDKTYGHLLPDSLEHVLDAFLAADSTPVTAAESDV
jgi:hypothetical protein